MSAPVLQVINSTDRRGAEIFAVELAACLEQRGRVLETVALVPGSARDGLDVPTLGTRSLGPRTLRALRRRIGAGRVVISHGSRTLPACIIAGRGTGQRLVYRSIGDVVTYAASRPRQARVTQYLRRAAAVVALWPGAAMVLEQRHRVSPAKIHTIPNGVPAAKFPVVDAPRRLAARARSGLDAGASVALFLGSLIPEKGAARAIEALARVPDAFLVIAGHGPERARVEALAEELAPGRVRFMGSVADPADALALADVLLLPSMTEGMPAVSIEAGLSGLPVVATDVGALREVVRDGETGRVVPDGDVAALGRALGDVLAAPESMGRRARAHCLEHFEIGVVAAAWERLLAQLDVAA